jgi:hypothetical protein
VSAPGLQAGGATTSPSELKLEDNQVTGISDKPVEQGAGKALKFPNLVSN